MKNPPIRILIVDDHFMVRQGLAALLADPAEFTIVGQAGTGEEAISLCDRTRPDVTLMDGVMPDISGIETIRRIRAIWPEARMIMISVNDTAEHVHEALEAGAWGYLPKSCDESETLRSIRLVATGQRCLATGLEARLAERNRTMSLSERELAVLRLAAVGRSNKEIAAQLHLGETSVKTYLSRIYTKLGARDRTLAVTLARQRGILRD